MEFLRRQLDDPEAAEPCGRCDNCTGRRLDADGRARHARRQAQERLDRPGVRARAAQAVAAPGWTRSAWRSRAGSPDGGREPGRAIGRLTDIGWGARLRPLLRGDDLAPDAVIDAAVAVLKAWDWAARPSGVVWLPSRERPVLVESFAQRIASIGRLPLLGALADDAPPRYVDPEDDAEPEQPNSAQRLAEVYRRLSVPSSVAVGGRCCSSTTSPTPGGRSRWQRCCYSGPGPPPCSR